MGGASSGAGCASAGPETRALRTSFMSRFREIAAYLLRAVLPRSRPPYGSAARRINRTGRSVVAVPLLAAADLMSSPALAATDKPSIVTLRDTLTELYRSEVMGRRCP